ncbi:hypothetical protein BCS42_07790 [Crenothrix sp. D3]|nr:hypothetical protein BCS42_07790 [Crenothrix sp. D3]
MPSPIEYIFKEIFGSLPNKKGTAYEQLAAIAMYELNEGSNVKHDDRLRGQFSKSLYQLDVHHQNENGTAIMGEAKDYSEQGKKVGRDDLQKLGGALPDIKEINSGIFFSATGYTKPARQYAEAADQITGGKPISLYELKVSSEEAEEGFVKTFTINIHASVAHPESGEFTAAFTTDGKDVLKSLLKKGIEDSIIVNEGVSEFYDETGAVILSIEELTSIGYGDVDTEINCAHACYWLPEHYIMIEGMLISIYGLEYKIPFSFIHREFQITDDSTHRLVIKDENGKSLKILTDDKIREYSFDNKGNVIKP